MSQQIVTRHDDNGKDPSPSAEDINAAITLRETFYELKMYGWSCFDVASNPQHTKVDRQRTAELHLLIERLSPADRMAVFEACQALAAVPMIVTRRRRASIFLLM